MATSFTDDEYAYLVAHRDDTRVPAVVGVTVTSIVLTLFFFALRIEARRLSFGYLRFDLSDWLILSAMVFSLTFYIIIAVGVAYGLGRHITEVNDVRLLIIIELTGDALHPLAMGTLKLSILAFYRSIFPTRRFKHVLYVVATCVILWCVITLVLGVILCTPIESLWDQTIKAERCISLNTLGLATTSAHIVTDFVILFLPVPLVLKLQVSTDRKRLIILTFVLGAGVCIVSIARIPVWAQPPSADIGWAQVPSGLLASAELAIGFLAASFPTYRPLIKRYFKFTNRTTTTTSRLTKDDEYWELHGGACRDSEPQHKVLVTASAGLGEPAANRSYSGILVTDEIELRSNVDNQRSRDYLIHSLDASETRLNLYQGSAPDQRIRTS